MLVAASWLGAAVLTGTVAWRAVAVLDTDTPRTGVLSTTEVSAALESARAAAATATPGATPTGTQTPTTEPSTASPTTDPTTEVTQEPTTEPTRPPSHTPSSSPSTTSPAPTKPAPAEVTRTWQVTGGTVSAACTGQTIRKVYATPQDGWTVETGSSGPDVVEVELHRSEHETKVVARCVGGVPTATITGDGSDEGGSEHDG